MCMLRTYYKSCLLKSDLLYVRWNSNRQEEERGIFDLMEVYCVCKFPLSKEWMNENPRWHIFPCFLSFTFFGISQNTGPLHFFPLTFADTSGSWVTENLPLLGFTVTSALPAAVAWGGDTNAVSSCCFLRKEWQSFTLTLTLREDTHCPDPHSQITSPTQTSE